eukprot:GHVO01052387.1.p1 GENE.GHVO01052387.1~~GHVO01052387.1.p1  ORF type:complete len:248 (-),score=21.94 GHVO01052387.1:142-819(-)
MSVFALKSAYLLVDASNVSTYSEIGTLSLTRVVLPRLLAKVQDITCLMMFFLLSLGWSVMRRTLTVLELRFASGVCVLSFYLGMFEIGIGGFQLSRYVLHAMTYLCIIVAINFNAAVLTSRLPQLDLTEACGYCYQHVAAFNRFRWIFVAFIMKPSILLFIKLSVVHYTKDDWDIWLLAAVENVIDLSIYIAVLYTFRPVECMGIVKHVLETHNAPIEDMEDEDE